MDAYLSNKIRDIQFIAIMLVVLQHSFFIKEEGYFFESFKANNFIQYFFSTGITKVSVPLFFIISGYLFFIDSDNSLRSYLRKCKKRIKTLLVPYLIFSVFWFLVIYAVKIFIKNENIVFVQVLKDLFGSNPVAYQLWFIRDLMILVVIAPLLSYSILKTKGYIVLLFFLLWLLLPAYEPWERFRESLLFFSFGAMLSIVKNYKTDAMISSGKVKFAVVGWLLILIFKSTYNVQGCENDFFNHLLSTSGICLGIISVWRGYCVVNQQVMLKYKKFTFMIYLLHAPVLMVLIRKIIFSIFGTKYEIVHIINYFMSPILTMFLCILLAATLKKYMPNFYNIITGNR